MVKKEQQEDKVDIQLTVEGIYKELCPACKEKLLSIAARSVAVGSLKERLKTQWEQS